MKTTCGYCSSGMGAEDTAIFISPIVEEMMKFLPILFFLFMFEPKDKTLLIVAVGICAGFATFENCCYILSSGAESLTYILSLRGIPSDLAGCLFGWRWRLFARSAVDFITVDRYNHNSGGDLK